MRRKRKIHVNNTVLLRLIAVILVLAMSLAVWSYIRLTRTEVYVFSSLAHVPYLDQLLSTDESVENLVLYTVERSVRSSSNWITVVSNMSDAEAKEVFEGLGIGITHASSENGIDMSDIVPIPLSSKIHVESEVSGNVYWHGSMRNSEIFISVRYHPPSGIISIRLLVEE